MTAFFIGDLALDEYYTAERWPGVADKGFITELPQECGGSIANAARRLGKSRSAVSTAIAALEVELGVDLFERGANQSR